ncbi:MAG: hypothetical protein JRJ57_04070 [Deltaproteobacteria bacterium]|nr:hypothetical protein [Deltaproteobacteria bacterium]
MKHKPNRWINFLCFCSLVIFLYSCGPAVRQYVTRDNSYNFESNNNKTIFLSIRNHDDWILQGNEIFKKELFSLAENILKENGFTLIDTKNSSRYIIILTIGSEKGQQPVHSYTTKETQVDVYGGGGLKETPTTHVTGGGSYHAVIVSCSCFDSETDRQVFFERTSTTMLNLDRLFGYTAEDMYKRPIKKIMQNFLKNFDEQSK